MGRPGTTRPIAQTARKWSNSLLNRRTDRRAAAHLPSVRRFSDGGRLSPLNPSAQRMTGRLSCLWSFGQFACEDLPTFPVATRPRRIGVATPITLEADGFR